MLLLFLVLCTLQLNYGSPGYSKHLCVTCQFRICLLPLLSNTPRGIHRLGFEAHHDRSTTVPPTISTIFNPFFSFLICYPEAIFLLVLFYFHSIGYGIWLLC